MSNDGQSSVFCRREIEFEDFHRFKPVSENGFGKQFCNIYKTRLNLLRDQILQKVLEAWGTKFPILNIGDLANLSEETESKCILVGTLYKQQELKPSILKSISDELQLPAQPSNLINYCATSDSLFLEDDVQRVKLAGKCPISKVVTGLVCAVIGHDLKNGTFWVDDWCFPGHHPTVPRPKDKYSSGNILLLSGLDFLNNVNLMSLNLLTEWIVGMAGNLEEQKFNSKLLAVIIAGNSIRNSVETFNRSGYLEKNAFNSTALTDVNLTIKKFDDFLSQILENCHVVLMPGEFDPSSHLMPQHAFHPQILPSSSSFTTLHSVTNPWIGRIQGKIIAGSSGQPISDIIKVGDLQDPPIDWMERTLLWQHYAPTSPDTLDVFPYYKCDPFVMKECPDVYFAGNMDKFETKLITGDEGQNIRLICVPQYSKSQTAVLVNLHTLNVNTISFGTNL